MHHHPSSHRKDAASTVAASVSSVALSVVASSHHWLHLAVLLLLGGSTHSMAMMTGVVWVKRAMILMSAATTAFAVYRMLRRKGMPLWMRGLTALSAVVSIGFIFFTLLRYGW
ncbi:hypothetical protein [Paenibacillus sp.]|uniref:hypothetical protein n=1 Tax=Paenibacillus sp. TaxID=58172 RepID=UPI002D2A34A0|nr:hypothetical protein [Paenibacillus sp.]HZG58725.1 hypothetical protein [Paenibacillus sp.]